MSPVLCSRDHRPRTNALLVQEDVPETLVALLQAFIQSTGGGVTPNERNEGVVPRFKGKL